MSIAGEIAEDNLQQLANLCARHKANALPAPTVDTCTECAGGQPTKARSEHETEMDSTLEKIRGAILALRSTPNATTLDQFDVVTDHLINTSIRLRKRLRAGEVILARSTGSMR